MNVITVSQTGTGASPIIITDYKQNPFNPSLSTVVSGTVNYTIQHTFDNVYAATYDPTSGNWFPHDNSDLVAATANANDNYAFPVTASRILMNSGTGTVTLTYIQGYSA